jgi:nucleotide-binding universal stress UspA family protein
MFSKILLATDGSDNALRAARQVAQMVSKQPAKVTLLSAAYVPSTYRDDVNENLIESFNQDARQVLQFTKEIFDEQKLPCDTKLALDLHPAEAILQEAKSGEYDLIVMGTRGLSAREAKKLGSVSQEVVQRAECAVLLVR